MSFLPMTAPVRATNTTKINEFKYYSLNCENN